MLGVIAQVKELGPLFSGLAHLLCGRGGGGGW